MNDSLDLRPGERTVVVGIGSELRGDDALGIELVRRLGDSDVENLFTVEGGVVPENHTSTIKRYDPDCILLVDAVEFDADPGEVRVIDPSNLRPGSFSSHNSPITLLTGYLERETDARIVLVGVQPTSIATGEALSPEVADAVEDLAAAIERELRGEED